MAEASCSASLHPKVSGWLFIWTPRVFAYRRRWFVLSNGCLSFFRNEDVTPILCLGSISLEGAEILTDESSTFAVCNIVVYHIKAIDETEKHRWVSLLSRSRNLTTSYDKLQNLSLTAIPSLRNCFSIRMYDLRGHNLSSSSSDIHNDTVPEEPTCRINCMNERDTNHYMFAQTIIKVCSEYLDLAETYTRTSDAVRTALRPQFERKMWKVPNVDGVVSSLSGFAPSLVESPSIKMYCAFVKDDKKTKKNSNVARSTAVEPNAGVSPITRRTRVPNRPAVPANLWNLIKHNVGKDQTSIPIPVNFSEPLSLLQRLTEDFEYAHILDRAGTIEDPGEQIALVAVFAISSYSSTVNRTGKPFNPLLGETFECDRIDDRGWRSIAEQVSHHPPISALHCEGKDWQCWQDQSIATKFQGQYLQFIPSGEVHLKFKSGNRYTWNKVTSNVHNLIVGKLWIDQEGDMVIKCFTNQFQCKLTFLTPGHFGGETHKVKGTVYNENGDIIFNVSGGYDTKIEIIRISENENDSSKRCSFLAPTVLWERTLPPSDCDKYYSFTIFACQLNEVEDRVAPTDSRNRPDQRLMEDGQWEEANKKKQQLEEFQRAARARRIESVASTSVPGQSSRDPFQPVWFQKVIDSDTKASSYIYQGNYWECKRKNDWSRCPTIFP